MDVGHGAKSVKLLYFAQMQRTSVGVGLEQTVRKTETRFRGACKKAKSV